MLSLLFKDVILGLLGGYVPILAMGKHFKKAGTCFKNGVSFFNVAQFNPFIFAILFPILMTILRYFNISNNTSNNISNNYILMGIIFGVVISSIGRFIYEVPIRVFDMKNPNIFHIYGIITWTLFFNTMGRLVYDFI